MGVEHPDAALHPEATGAAADVVSQHQDEQDIKFYSGWFCPYGSAVDPAGYYSLTDCQTQICPARLDRPRRKEDPLSIYRN